MIVEMHIIDFFLFYFCDLITKVKHNMPYILNMYIEHR